MGPVGDFLDIPKTTSQGGRFGCPAGLGGLDPCRFGVGSQEVEGFLASGFLSLTDCLAENSFIHFSQNQGQLVETAAWLPCFSISHKTIFEF